MCRCGLLWLAVYCDNKITEVLTSDDSGRERIPLDDLDASLSVSDPLHPKRFATKETPSVLEINHRKITKENKISTAEMKERNKFGNIMYCH